MFSFACSTSWLPEFPCVFEGTLLGCGDHVGASQVLGVGAAATLEPSQAGPLGIPCFHFAKIVIWDVTLAKCLTFKGSRNQSGFQQEKETWLACWFALSSSFKTGNRERLVGVSQSKTHTCTLFHVWRSTWNLGPSLWWAPWTG